MQGDAVFEYSNLYDELNEGGALHSFKNFPMLVLEVVFTVF